MSEHIHTQSAHIEVAFAGQPTQIVPVAQFPFLIGRGKDNGNHLSLSDMRVSRNCAAIVLRESGIFLEDRGQREGVSVNGYLTKLRLLVDGDRIRLGVDDECQLIFRLPPEAVTQGEAESKLRTILGSMGTSSSDELNGLRVLLEATSLMGSQLPLISVLSTMLDHAIVITRADRGMLLEPDAAGTLQVVVARGRDAESLEPSAMNPSRSVLGSALELQTAVVNEDLNFADLNLQSAQSVVRQLLRSSVVIPLYCAASRLSDASDVSPRRDLLGAVYLDSKRTATFSALDRQILDALGAQAGSILENARLIQRERERQRLEQELSIAREIQQGLIPQGSQDYPNFSITGLHHPCNEVGGDYFDIFPLPDGRLAVLIADVAGKGLGAALVTTMLQGALSGMTIGVDPVKVFNHLNHFLCARESVVRCATMFLGLLSPDGTMEFVRAGHPAPLLMRKGEVTELFAEGSLPIGISENEHYASSTTQLTAGDTLLLYTDGVTEAENPKRELFQERRLMDIFAAEGKAPLSHLLNGILSTVDAFTEGAVQSDDVTLLALRYLGPQEHLGAKLDTRSVASIKDVRKN